MWIRRLEVTNFAGIAEAAIDLTPGLNVLHGPNELGKSSLVRAVRAALLLQSTSAAANRLFDWHTDAAPTVTLTFEEETQRIWRVRKEFGSRGPTYLDFSRDGIDFNLHGKGREVDGELQDILRWGIETPGGRGRARVPESFITTALLGEQDGVTAILDRSLAADPDSSGRERLTEALQAMAEDPRLKEIIASVQAKVDEAYTGTGRRRTGRASPWSVLREQRTAAEERARNVSQQVEESEGARLRIQTLHAELLQAQAADERHRAALEQQQKHAKAAQNLAAAEAEVDRIQKLIDRRDVNAVALASARKRVSKWEKARCETQQSARALAPQLAAARERVRELETGADEQERRLREEEATNRRLKLDNRQERFQQKVARAEQLAALDRKAATLAADIESRDRGLREKRDLVQEAQGVNDADRDALDELEVQRHCARYLTALETARAYADDLKTSREHARQASAWEREAAAEAEAAALLNAPDTAELEHLKALETELRIAKEKLAVGVLVQVALDKSGGIEVSTDEGEPKPALIDSGRSLEFEAERELRIAIAGIGSVRVRAGSRNLVQSATSAQEQWDSASRPVLSRAGCASLADLETLRSRANQHNAAVENLRQRAAEARVRAENVDELERRSVVAQAEVERCSNAIQEVLDDGETVDRYIEKLNEPPGDEYVVEEAAKELRERIGEREELCARMMGEIKGDEQDAAARLTELAAKRDTLARANEEWQDWREFLEQAETVRREIQRLYEAVDAELQAIRAEATTEVDAARETHEKLVGEDSRLRTEHDRADKQLAVERTELARLEGEAGGFTEAIADEDLSAAKTAREQCRVALEAVPAPADGDELSQPEELERAAAAVADQVRQLEMQLHNAEGALEQVGGQYIQEQQEQAQQAIETLDGQERELEVEYGAWQLLREALTEAEQEDSAHLGRALVQPISERMTALTDGRYGEIVIGPQLDATGIQLAGTERPFDGLSVGALEQISILLRLSIAESLGNFVILDDQLTQSDPKRLSWMRTLLQGVAENVQVVVVTCHPEDYIGEDVTANVVDLTECVRRSVLLAARPTDEGPNSPLEDHVAPVDRVDATHDAHSASSKGQLPSSGKRSSRRRRVHRDTGDDLSATLRASLRQVRGGE